MRKRNVAARLQAIIIVVFVTFELQFIGLSFQWGAYALVYCLY
jgi:hypothetical protein